MALQVTPTRELAGDRWGCWGPGRGQIFPFCLSCDSLPSNWVASAVKPDAFVLNPDAFVLNPGWPPALGAKQYVTDYTTVWSAFYTKLVGDVRTQRVSEGEVSSSAHPTLPSRRTEPGLAGSNSCVSLRMAAMSAVFPKWHP